MEHQEHFLPLLSTLKRKLLSVLRSLQNTQRKASTMYEGWNFNSGNYLFTTDTK